MKIIKILIIKTRIQPHLCWFKPLSIYQPKLFDDVIILLYVITLFIFYVTTLLYYVIALLYYAIILL